MTTSKKYLKAIVRNEGLNLLAVGFIILTDAKQRNMTKEVFNEVHSAFTKKMYISEDSFSDEDREKLGHLMSMLGDTFLWNTPEPSRYQFGNNEGYS